MATVTCSGTFSTSFIMVSRTGFFYYQDGILDPVSGTIKAEGIGRWNDWAGSSWTNTKSYVTSNKTIKWTAPVIDLGAVQSFAITTTTDFTGSLAYIVHVSETGIFGGEETEYYLEDGNLNISSFYGRYLYVTAVVTGNELRRFTIEANTETTTYKMIDIDSSTCSGPNTARVIPLPTAVSGIRDINIEVKRATPYAVNLYVSAQPTSVIVIPVVVSKQSSSPTFALYGIDNDPRDAVVDITVNALPRMVMYGGNIYTIT